MKKQYRALIICAVMLVALCAMLLVALYVLPKKAAVKQETTEDTTALKLLSFAADQVQGITVANASGIITATAQAGSLTIPELSGYPLDAMQVSSLLTNSTQLTALRKIGGAELAPADFGLDQPAAAVTITTTAGGVYGFKVGDAAPASLGSYVLLDDTVYLVNTAYVSIFEKTLTDYISLTVAEKLGDGEVLDSIQLTRNGETISLTYVPEEVVETQQDGQTVTETIPAYYAMNNPVPAALSYSKVTGWSTLMAGFSADAIAAVAPDAAQIKAYGLDQPTYKLSYTTTAGNAVTLYAAEADGGVCYLMREGVNLVYVTTSSALGWLNVTPEILLSTLFPGVQAADVQAVSLVSSTGASYELAAADGAYTNNGQQITADEFTAVVEGVFAIAPTYTDAVSETQLKPVLTIIISYTDGASALLRLIPTGSGALYAFLDDDPSQYTCDESVVQSLLALCKQAGGV